MSELLLLDGGTGRELARLGAPFRVPEWSALALIEAPEFVTRVHQRYVEAGAQVITTNSYALVPYHLGEARFDVQGQALAELAGRLAREVADAADHPVRVSGSLPPVCGSYRADLFDPAAARPILAALIKGLSPHIDQWHAETLSTTTEAELVRECLGADRRPLWLSFTLDDVGEGADAHPRLRSGERVEAAVETAQRLGAAALLFNCSQPEVMAEALKRARYRLAMRGAVLPLGVYANAFPPQPRDAEANAALDEIRADLTPAAYLDFARAWQALGASIIGGCCGIGPEHIAALRAGLAASR